MLHRKRPVQHVVTSSASALACSRVTAGQDFNASLSHVLICPFACNLCVSLDMGPKTLFLEDLCSHKHCQWWWFFFSNDLLQVFYANIIVLDGKLGDLWLQLHNTNACNYIFEILEIAELMTNTVGVQKSENIFNCKLYFQHKGSFTFCIIVLLVVWKC